MRHTILPDGSLLLTAGNSDRSELAEASREGYCDAESFVADSFHDILTFIPPENIGAMTGAPILTNDAEWPDDGNGPVPYNYESPVWWFEAYQIIDPWEELARKGRVIFQRAA